MNKPNALSKFIFPEKVILKKSINFIRNTEGVKLLLKYLREHNLNLGSEIKLKDFLVLKDQKSIPLEPKGKIYITQDHLVVILSSKTGTKVI